VDRFVAADGVGSRLGHLIFQTKRWNEAIRMADLKGAVAITRHYHAGSVRVDDIYRYMAQLPAVSALPAFLRYFVAPAVNPPRQYFPSRINAAISGKTLISEPSAMR
jgi:hypothetical protein